MTEKERKEKMNDAKSIDEYLFYAGTITYTQELGNVNTLEEWIKWLPYHSKEETDNLVKVLSKESNLLTSDEINKLKKYHDGEYFANIFTRYLNEDCTYEEYLEISSFMKNNSIEEYMKQKLTAEELKEAENKMNELIEIYGNNISEKLDDMKKEENYRQLSMIDAYVLHILLHKNIIKHLNKLNQEIFERMKENNYVMQKSIVNAGKHFVV